MEMVAHLLLPPRQRYVVQEISTAQLSPAQVEELCASMGGAEVEIGAEYVTLDKVPIRRGAELSSAASGVLQPGERVLAIKTAAVKGRTRVCCTLNHAVGDGECWITFRSEDGQRQIKRSDGSEDRALQGFWEGLPQASVALRTAAQDRPRQAGASVDAVCLGAPVADRSWEAALAALQKNGINPDLSELRRTWDPDNSRAARAGKGLQTAAGGLQAAVPAPGWGDAPAVQHPSMVLNAHELKCQAMLRKHRPAGQPPASKWLVRDAGGQQHAVQKLGAAAKDDRADGAPAPGERLHERTGASPKARKPTSLPSLTENWNFI